MRNGILLEEISKDELLQLFTGLTKRISVLEEKITLENSRDVTLTELAKKTGFCKAHVRRIITQKNIPFSYEGKELTVKREHLGKFRVKKSYDRRM